MDSPADPGNSATDAELAARVSGDGTGASANADPAGVAEAELCRRFAPRIRLYGIRHLRDRSLADDLVQRCLETTIEKLRSSQVQDTTRIASFILGVARMHSREMIRKKLREEPAALDFPDTEEATIADHETGAEPLTRERLRACLGALSERERSVVLLTYYDDRNAEQIAESWSTSAGNVRVIRHRAIDRLRRCMGLLEGIS